MTEQYKLKVVIDDSQIKALEQRLGKLSGMNTGTSSGSKQGGGLGGLGGQGGGIGKNLGKLAGIALGVATLVALIKKITGMLIESSPMLQAMLKLFNFSIMLILRPIGDFIGFMLRPIMIMMLRLFILPFYRTYLPIAQRMGNWLGNVLVPVIQKLFEFITGIAQVWIGVVTFNFGMISQGVDTLKNAMGINIDWTKKGIHETINVKDAIKETSGNIVTKLGEVKDGIGSRVAEAMNKLSGSPGFSGSTKGMQDMMKLFGAQTTGEDQGAFGLRKMMKLLGGGTDALRLIGAAQTDIQSGISAGDFGNIGEALQAYMDKIMGFRKDMKSGVMNQSTITNSGNINNNFYGTVYDKNQVEKMMMETMEKSKSRSNTVF